MVSLHRSTNLKNQKPVYSGADKFTVSFKSSKNKMNKDSFLSLQSQDFHILVRYCVLRQSVGEKICCAHLWPACVFFCFCFCDELHRHPNQTLFVMFINYLPLLIVTVRIAKSLYTSHRGYKVHCLLNAAKACVLLHASNLQVAGVKWRKHRPHRPEHKKK